MTQVQMISDDLVFKDGLYILIPIYLGVIMHFDGCTLLIEAFSGTLPEVHAALSLNSAEFVHGYTVLLLRFNSKVLLLSSARQLAVCLCRNMLKFRMILFLSR